MAGSRRLGTLGLELLARGKRRRLIFCGGQEQRVVTVDADPQVVAVDRLQAVAHRVHALWDRLIAVVVSFGRELQQADQLAIGEKGKEHRTFGTGGFFAAGDRLAQPDVRQRLALVVLDPESLIG